MRAYRESFGWWCRVCGTIRRPIRYPQIGAMCAQCMSGRIAPTVESPYIATRGDRHG